MSQKENSPNGGNRQQRPEPDRPLVLYAFARNIPVAGWQPELPRAYDERLSRMRSAASRQRTLGGLWLLQRAADMAGLGVPALDRLGRDAHGRPSLPTGPAFNISHSGGLVACVVAEAGMIGLDVERVRPIDIARFDRFLSPQERQAAEQDPRAFFTAWTAREAVVKATGRVGLARLARVEVGDDWARVDNDHLHIQWPSLAPGYQACLATAEPVPAIDLRELTD